MREAEPRVQNMHLDIFNKTKGCAISILGEVLQLGENSPWKAVNELRTSNEIQSKAGEKHDKIIGYLMEELERLNRDVAGLRRELIGLKVNAGKAKSAKAKMETELAAAQSKLDEARQVVLH
jgi:chromosome segregation ATPase